MFDKQVIAYLRYVHGAFNLIMALMFLYLGSLGFMIRKGRKAGSPPAGKTKRHRRLGPLLMPLGVMGFFAGLVLVYLDEGHFLEYPPHFFAGLAIAALLVGTFSISRKIKGQEPSLRNVHFTLGIFILCLYMAQVLLGLGILL